MTRKSDDCDFRDFRNTICNINGERKCERCPEFNQCRNLSLLRAIWKVKSNSKLKKLASDYDFRDYKSTTCDTYGNVCLDYLSNHGCSVCGAQRALRDYTHVLRMKINNQ